MAQHSGGAKIGVKLATIVSNAMVATHTKLLHVRHRLAMKIFSDISDVISEEVHRTTGSILREFHDSLPDDSIAHPLTKFMATEHGQLQALTGTFASSGGIFSSVAQVVNNELSPAVRGLLASNPHMLPDPGTLANMAARGYAEKNDVVQSIGQQGIDAGWANAMVAMNAQYPDAGTMLDMMRRGIIGRDDFKEWSIHNGVPANVADAWATLIDVPLTPPDAALAYLRGNIDKATAIASAAKWGVNEGTFETLVANTGEPLGLQELLEARRRGFIDDATLERGIVQSRVRNEWIPTAKAIAFSPISTADAVEAAVQNHISQAQASTIATQNGLEPGYFDILYQTAGAPLSRTEMEQLFNRGLATEEQVKQAVRESRLKDKYVDQAFQLHTRLITARELGQSVQYGAIKMADAVKKAMEEGYTQEDATILVSAAVNSKLHQQRMSVLASVENLYEINAMSLEQAQQIAGQLGFEPAETQFIFQAAEFKRNEKLVAAGMSAIRSKFVAHHITSTEASALLDQLGIPHQQRDASLQIWQVEHDANVRLLTPAQIIKAGTLGIFQPDEVLSRLTALGYSADDANALVQGA